MKKEATYLKKRKEGYMGGLGIRRPPIEIIEIGIKNKTQKPKATPHPNCKHRIRTRNDWLPYPNGEHSLGCLLRYKI